MIVSIDVEDEAWNAVSGLAALTQQACEAALSQRVINSEPVELSVLFTSDEEIARLNRQWRDKSGATNVLSFPSSVGQPVPPGEATPLGDVVLAFGTIEREAQEQGKDLATHTTHLIVHACLHLLGYDHMTETEADEMETLEIGILSGLGIDNPYLENHERH